MWYKHTTDYSSTNRSETTPFAATRMDLETSLFFSLSCIGEGNGNLLQYSRLENPRDRGASWAAVYGVAQSQT